MKQAWLGLFGVVSLVACTGSSGPASSSGAGAENEDLVDGGPALERGENAPKDDGGATSDGSASDAPECSVGSSSVSGELGFAVKSAEARRSTLGDDSYLSVELHDRPGGCGLCAGRSLRLTMYGPNGAIAPGTYPVTVGGPGVKATASVSDWFGDCSNGGGPSYSGQGTIVLEQNDAGGVRGTFDLTIDGPDGGVVASKGVFESSCLCK